ncbi:MAG: Trp family transcriptional regulator [bacterium]|nr:Trp family transcriptional regulator [bacterium]
MSHVSRKQLSNREFNEIYKSLIRSLHKLKGDSLENFFWEFLTPTEKVMLAKRLLVIILLEQGVSQYKIWKMLNVSPSTIERYGKKLDRGGFEHMRKILGTKEDKLTKIIKAIWHVIEPPPYHVSRDKYIAYLKKHHH